ncbi:hypothetical protein LHGZ1_2225 [Laribacter hongkongensis]|uniref:Uncharacterized protein n=1 Tax=Laribacter hongkongensis TaxID=168471 RepID=A0A248LL04_9NEIS|nr:hypothetical protein LHGZ1_2225 [Laribacter hongkongensis]
MAKFEIHDLAQTIYAIRINDCLIRFYTATYGNLANQYL